MWGAWPLPAINSLGRKTNQRKSNSTNFEFCSYLFVSRTTKEQAAVNIPDPAHLPMPDLSSQPIDPDEPLYCHCQQVSFGEMIGCDNEDVSLYNIPDNVLHVTVDLSNIYTTTD